jgi:hypothetical protein
MRLLLALALLPSAVFAQTAVRPLGAVTGSPLNAPSASPAASLLLLSPSASPAFASLTVAAPTAAPALSAAPAALLPAFAAVAAPAPAVPTALPRFAAAASGPEKAPPGNARAAAALSASAADFARLVSELMGGDKSKSESASAALLKLKGAHLNDSLDKKKTPVLDLKPMQKPVGMIEVEEKVKDLRGMSAKKQDDWLQKKSVPVLKDYKGRKRPVDHHHESRAAWEAKLDEVYTHRYFDDELHELIKALPKEQFYAVTRAMGLFYDRDENGKGPLDPKDLPEDVRGLVDDPYRSLAGAVRDRGGYEKTSLPFAEFKWAQFFRERLKIASGKDGFDKAVEEALKLVHDSGAKDLPGYKSK